MSIITASTEATWLGPVSEGFCPCGGWRLIPHELSHPKLQPEWRRWGWCFPCITFWRVHQGQGGPVVLRWYEGDADRAGVTWRQLTPKEVWQDTPPADAQRAPALAAGAARSGGAQ